MIKQWTPVDFHRSFARLHDYIAKKKTLITRNAIYTCKNCLLFTTSCFTRLSAGWCKRLLKNLINIYINGFIWDDLVLLTHSFVIPLQWTIFPRFPVEVLGINNTGSKYPIWWKDSEIYQWKYLKLTTYQYICPTSFGL